MSSAQHKFEKLVDVDDVIGRFTYNTLTGEVWWKVGIKKGRRAGKLHTDGYRIVIIDRMRLMEHRLIWAMHYEEWPAGEIDHKNQRCDDNRIENLRLATRSQNEFNKGVRKNNACGFKGVRYCARMKKKWQAQIGAHGIRYVIGHFDTPEEAHAAYAAKAIELHGDFARVK